MYCNPKGYIIPLDCIQGLMYVKIRPFTDEEAGQLPAVFLTRDIPWDPSRHDGNGGPGRLKLLQPFMMALTLQVIILVVNGEAYTSICVQSASLQPSILSQTRQNVVFASDLNDTSESHVIIMNSPNYESQRIYFLNVL